MFAKIQEMLTVREEIPKRSFKLVELTQFTEAEPGNLYVLATQKLKKIAASKIKEFVEVCSRPIVHAQVWEQVDAKLKEYKVKTKFTPVDKIGVVVDTVRNINQSIVNHFWSMDELFPVFLYVMVRARIPQMGAEIAMIEDLIIKGGESDSDDSRYGR